MSASVNGRIHIAGAGPAGLAAALAIAKGGGEARVFERRERVGARFHGDFQGLENWSTERDVLAELDELGIAPTFDHVPFRECVFFGPDGKRRLCRSQRPLWYLVRRGSGAGTLDDALKKQALEAGVHIDLGHALEHLPDGGIVAHGPRHADVIAVGYLFETNKEDGAFAAVSNELAPFGYSYLLICNGRATLAACLFSDFHNEKTYLARSVDFFEKVVGIRLRGEKRFGGFGNVALPPRLRRGNLLFAGEGAGFQDTLFGFGMRYALLSGSFAGRAVQEGDLSSYELACSQRLLPLHEAAMVNRLLYERAGHRGYNRLLSRLCGVTDSRAWLRRYYEPRWWTRLVYPLARAKARRRKKRNLEHECREDCDCTYCRCIHEARNTEGNGSGGAECIATDD